MLQKPNSPRHNEFTHPREFRYRLREAGIDLDKFVAKPLEVCPSGRVTKEYLFKLKIAMNEKGLAHFHEMFSEMKFDQIHAYFEVRKNVQKELAKTN